MLRYIGESWKASIKQPFLIVALFLYRFAWGFTLYKMCQDIILPLLHRYPGNEVSASYSQLFLAEGQFVLLKTDISRSYIMLLLGLLLVKVILTPFLNAGILFSLSNTHYPPGYRFFRGMAELGRHYFLYYLLQIALTFAPLWWIWPKFITIFTKGVSLQGMLSDALPYAAGMLIYGYLIYLLFLYVQIGKAWSNPLTRTLGTALKGLPVILGIAAAILLVTLLASLLILGASLYWAGFWTLLLYQAYRFVQSLLSLWGIAAQHQYYKTRTNLL